MQFISKILYEASYDRDAKTVNLAKKYINKIKEYLDAFDGEPNNVVDCFPNRGYITVKLGELVIYLMDARHYRGTSGGYIDNKIASYNIQFRFDNESRSLSYKLNESNLLHELIHYFDNKRAKDKESFTKAGERKERGTADANYFNNPYEFNANFLQTVFPRVEDLVQSEEDYFSSSFDQFRNAVFKSNYRLKDFYYYLTDKNKQKLLKRLYNIYNAVKKNELSSESLDDENLEKLPDYSSKKRTTLIQHLKSLFSKAA